MLICIDSSTLIFGLNQTKPSAAQVLQLVGQPLEIVIPRLVAQEVTRNLNTPTQIRQFYRLFENNNLAQIVDEPVPVELVKKYISLGLPAKADAFIGAFAEWRNVQYLISENRHFLRDLSTSAFQVKGSGEFLEQLKT